MIFPEVVVKGWSALLALSLLVSASAWGASDYHDPKLSLDQRVEDLLGRMTVQEKIGQLEQGLFDVGMEKHVETFFPPIRAAAVGAYICMVEDAKYRNAMQRVAVTETRLGIPLLFGQDIIHGQRTVFPIPLGMACAWDPDLFEKAQTIAAREGRAMGLNWTFAPMCDLSRDIRWGRVAETGGEDPYLNSLYVAASVHGFQGADPASPGHVVACLKHFAGYSAAEGGRDYDDTEIPNFVFRNFHLPSFHAGVEAGALTVMSAFNANDGIPAVADHHLLTDILRGEWGFKGFVDSDWLGVPEVIDWGYASDDAAAARLCISAGNDMEMISKTYATLADQIQKGKLAASVLDEAVRRVLRVKFQAGIFEHPYVDEGLYQATMLQPDSVALARQAVARSAVLLKNNGILPLPKDLKHVALIGPFGDEAREMLGCWIGQGKAKNVVTLATALKDCIGKTADLKILPGCDINGNRPRTKTLTDGTVVIDTSVPAPAGLFDLSGAVEAAKNADVIIMALGEPWSWTGENASRARLSLTGRQQELYDAVAAVGKPVIVVLFCGRPLTLPHIFDSAAAVLVAWQPGIQAGPGLLDVIFGDVNPSGRLTVSWPQDVGQLPLFYNRYNTGRPAKDFVDYRDMSREPLFQFGFGLTYTQFSYGSCTVVPGTKGRPDRVRTTVTNTGKREGDEVAQLYIRELACPEGARPEQELRGFQHVVLQPGESKEVSFELTDQVLGYVGRDGLWKVDSGDYQLWISPHAHAGDHTPYTRP